MHNAPSVSYPVGRCAFQRRLYQAFTLVTSAVCAAWALQQGLSVAWGVATAMAVTGVVLGWRALSHTGVLTWDGQVWCLHDQGLGCEDALGEVSVVLDVQKALLLRWQPTSDTVSQKPVWLWLGAEHAQVRWPALRRAIYQRTEMN